MFAQQILVFHPGTIGDTLASLPVFDYIRKLHPKDHLVHLSWFRSQRRAAEALLAPTRYVDRFIGGSIPDGTRFPHVRIAALLWRLRHEHFDIMYYCAGGWPNYGRSFRRNMMLLSILRIPTVIGNRRPHAFSDPRLPTPKLFQMYFEELFDEPVSHSDFNLELSARELQVGADFFASLHIAPGMVPIAVGCGGKKQVCRYPEERYVKIVQHMVNELKIFPILFGGPEDKPAIDRILAGVPEKSAAAATGLSLRESIALLKQCRFYCGNDTGTIHMAAAAGLPCVGIYAAHSFRGCWEPLGEGHIILRRHPDCEGCFRRNCFKDPPECLASITVDEVLAQVQEMMRRCAN